MYHAAICEDDPKDAQLLENMLLEIAEENGIDLHCSHYLNTEALQRAMTTNGDINLLFLDILMEGKNGLEFAEELRRKQMDQGIVFTTCSTDYILQGYDVQAIKYIVKPLKKEEVKRAVLYDYTHNFLKKYITVSVDNAVRRIPVSQVLFIENKIKKSQIFLEDERILCREKFGDLVCRLGVYGICKCHQSFMINLNNVIELQRYEARLKDGRVVPISKKFYLATKDAFLKNLKLKSNGME